MKTSVLDLNVLTRRPGWVLLGILLLSFFLYGQILTAPFVYDDHELLLNSPLIKSLTAPFQNWQMAGPKLLSFWTFAVNYRIDGKHTFGFHVVNVVVHSFNAWFLYLLVRLVYKTPRFKNTLSSPDNLAFCAAIIFLCHPLQTQAVSYIWQRTELLNAFFYFLTLLCYLQGRLNRGKGYFILAALFFICGFYSKGMIVSFPLLALVLEDALFDVPRSRRVFFRCTGAGTIVILLLFWHQAGINEFRSHLLLFLMNITVTMISPAHCYTQLDVVVRYVFLTLFPFWQNLDHAAPLVETFWNPRVLLATGFILFVFSAGFYFWKRNRLIAVGIFWFFIALLPSSLLGGRDPMVEHRLYFSLAGFSLVAASVAMILFAHKEIYGWIAVFFVTVLSLLTFSRNHLWQSPRLLFEDTVRKSPHLARPALMLGTVYLMEDRYDDAAKMFARVIKIDPQSPESYNNLGLIFLRTRRSMEAEEMFEKAIAVKANFTPAYINLGYFALGIGDDDRAEELFKRALTLGKKDSALVGLANIALACGRLNEARDLLEQAIVIEPRNSKAYGVLAEMYQRMGDKTRSLKMKEKAKAVE